MTNYRTTIFVFALIATIFISHNAEATKPSQSILIVHSYHQGFHWTDNVMAGMLDVLQKEAPDAEIHAEYLDAKRLSPETLSPLFDETLRRKFPSTLPSVILVSDDPAFDLMLTLREKHFPGVPLVFCGVNKFNDERIAGHAAVTGVTEDFNIKGTVEIALKLHPNAKHMAVITDSTETGEFNRQRFLQATPEFSGRLDVIKLFGLSTEELSSQLKTLPKDSFILNLSFFRDRLGQSYSTNESNHMIASLSGLPVYSCWDFILVGDVVGGLVVSGRQQGEASASMAAQVLKGLRAEEIPILRTSPNAYMFDYNVMQRFGIKESSLPKGSIVLNRQVSIWKQYGGWLLGIVVIGGLQAFLILTLLTRGKRLRAGNAALLESKEAVRKSEENFKDIFESTLSGYWDWNLVDNTEYLSPTFKSMFGYQDHEMESSPEAWQRIIFPEDLPGVLEVFDRHVKSRGREPFSNEVRYRHKDGTTVWVICAGRVVEWSTDGKPLRMIGCHVDITERKQAEDSLRESELHLRTLANSGQALIWTSGSDKLCNYFNQPWLDFTGRSLEQELGNGWTEGVHPDDFQRCLDIYVAAFDERESFNMEYRLRHHSGEYRWIIDQGTPRYNTQGKLLGYVGHCLDINDRKQQEVALRESEARFRLLFENAPLSYQSLDERGYFLDVNKKWLETLGYEREVVIGKWFGDFLGPGFKEHFDKNFPMFKQACIIDGVEFDMVARNGRIICVVFNGRVQLGRDGEFLRTHCIFTDITERKRAEKELLVAKEAAEAANHAKSAFLANMSHEIRTPLNGVLGMLQLIQTSENLTEVEMYAEMAIRAGQRLTSLLGDILDLSRIEAGRMPIASNPFALADIFTALDETFSPMNYSKGVPLVINPSPDIPTDVVGDDVRVRQILFNLVGNAMKFSDQGEVLVEVSTLLPHPSGMVRLLFIVSDTGIGVPDEKIDQICAPFTQVSEDLARSHQGAGLGLAIVRKLIDAMGGTLTFDSTEGQGTSVYLMLPFSIPEHAAIPTNLESIRGENIPVSLRLLLVEDDEVCSVSARLTLKKMGHDVVTAKNGAEALEALQENSFDCVLMDVQMPIMDGLEATRGIRSGNFGALDPQVPIIAMTAYAMTGDRERFLEAGMNDYIAKPVQVAELKKALERVAEKLGKGGVL